MKVEIFIDGKKRKILPVEARRVWQELNELFNPPPLITVGGWTTDPVLDFRPTATYSDNSDKVPSL